MTKKLAPTNDDLVKLWEFVRRDLGPREFERWCCESPTLEATLGQELSMDLIAADYRDAVAVVALRERLDLHLRSRPDHSCGCLTVAYDGVVDMGAHEAVFESLDEVAKRGAPYWWLWAEQCRACGQAWLVGSEERQNDVYCMRRLSPSTLADIINRNHWPPDFDRYESLLEFGRNAGRSVRFIEPLTSSSLHETVTELARARPGIALSVIAGLLNLDLETATQIAQDVVHRDNAQIDLDS